MSSKANNDKIMLQKYLKYKMKYHLEKKNNLKKYNSLEMHGGLVVDRTGPSFSIFLTHESTFNALLYSVLDDQYTIITRKSATRGNQDGSITATIKEIKTMDTLADVLLNINKENDKTVPTNLQDNDKQKFKRHFIDIEPKHKTGFYILHGSDYLTTDTTARSTFYSTRPPDPENNKIYIQNLFFGNNTDTVTYTNIYNKIDAQKAITESTSGKKILWCLTFFKYKEGNIEKPILYKVTLIAPNADNANKVNVKDIAVIYDITYSSTSPNKIEKIFFNQDKIDNLYERISNAAQEPFVDEQRPNAVRYPSQNTNGEAIFKQAVNAEQNTNGEAIFKQAVSTTDTRKLSIKDAAELV